MFVDDGYVVLPGGVDCKQVVDANPWSIGGKGQTVLELVGVGPGFLQFFDPDRIGVFVQIAENQGGLACLG